MCVCVLEHIIKLFIAKIKFHICDSSLIESLCFTRIEFVRFVSFILGLLLIFMQIQTIVYSPALPDFTEVKWSLNIFGVYGYFHIIRLFFVRSTNSLLFQLFQYKCAHESEFFHTSVVTRFICALLWLEVWPINQLALSSICALTE